MFILLTHKVATEQYGYRLEYIELPEEEGQFDITLSAYEDEAEGRFHCVFKYNTDLFLPETMRRMAAHYTRLLDRMTRAPGDLPASRLAMLGDRERERLVGEWSRPALPYAGHRDDDPFTPVHVLIARTAAEHPEAVAVSTPSPHGGAHRLTYADLERRAADTAARLRTLGIGEGSVVVLCLDKSPELIVALLAVLAGRRRLPSDPARPARRPARPPRVCNRSGARPRRRRRRARDHRYDRRDRDRDRDRRGADRPDAHPHRPRTHRTAPGRAGGPGRPGLARVRHHHLRLDRPPQGRPRQPPQPRSPPTPHGGRRTGWTPT